MAAVAAAAYAWRAPSYLEAYYAAAVRSMSMSWHDFVFGAFDPAGTVTLDKLPGALWVQALAVRFFGVHAWVIVLPQVVEGVLSVLVLYRVVRRLCGARAGILAAVVLAGSPATVALDRGNISDTLMILLLLLAADAAVAAVLDDRWVWLVLAGFWVGAAFQAKMIEAWIALPAFVLVYAVASAGSWRHRVAGCGTMVAVAVMASLSWMTVVTLVPSASRPYVDGSQNDSLFQQVFVYNGFGRVDQETPNQLLSQSIGLRIPPPPPPSWHRVLTGALGRDGGWLLPAAVVSCAAGLFARRRRPRGDPARAHALLWGAWLVAMGLSFSVGSSLNAYYVAALSPPVAALVASGAQLAWRGRRSTAVRITVAATVVVTVGYAAWLVPGSGTGLPGWLEVAVLVIGAAAVCAVTVSARSGRSERPAAVALVGSLAAVLLVPVVASVSMVANRLGPFDTPFQPQAVTVAVRDFFGVLATTEQLLPQIERARNGAPYLMATETSALAAPFIYDSGQEVLPIGGFTGTIPAPTLPAIESMVHAGAFHLVIQSPTPADRRLVWIEHHCLRLPRPTTAVPTAATFSLYFCQPAS